MKQGKLASHCSLTGPKDADLNSHCISNAKRLFYETLSPKKHGQLSFGKKGYQDTFLVSFTVTSANTNTAIHNGEQISSPF